VPGVNDEPLERMASCHEQIERHLQQLDALVERVAAYGCDAVAQSAAADVLRFFDTSGTEHHRDEDEDVFPLLRRRAGGLGRAEVAAAIDELEREHATMGAQWQRLRGKLSAIGAARGGAIDKDEVQRFAWLYRRHMDQESLLVLPFAREALSAEERAHLAKSMAARRARRP
jgi:hemerythrin-like domain-containing protein